MDLTEDRMLATIKDAIENNKIAVFMKGTPAQPKCGFSAAVVAILDQMKVPYVGIDAIADPRFRHVLSAHTQWPTLPQVFVGGKLVGGCDIVREMKASGEFDKVVAEAIGQMADLAEVKSLIERALPGSRVTVHDLTGGGDHLSVAVAAPQFAGKGLIEQHRMIYAALAQKMPPLSREIHALQIKTSVSAGPQAQ